MFQIQPKIILIAVIANILGVSLDITITWTSPVLPKLRSNNSEENPLKNSITTTEESWIGSLINIGALIGPIPFSYIGDVIGRKSSLLICAIPLVVSFLILAFAKNIYFYYFARLLAGISLGGGYTILPVYVAEIAEKSYRGRIGASLNIFWTFGDLIPYLLGPYISILEFNLILLCFPSLFIVLFIFMAPETPYFLISCNKTEEASKVLTQLRPVKSRCDVSEELEQISASVNHKQHKKINGLFKTKANYKALIISLGLIIFQQLSGINAMLFYTQLIFETTGSHIPSDISAIIIGLVLFLSSLIPPFMADKYNRKFFLIVSSGGSCISLFTFGLYFYLLDNNIDMSMFSFLPVTSMVLFIIAYNFGLGAFPWVVISEVFSPEVKTIGTSLASIMCWLSSFLVTKYFVTMTDAFGIAGTFWVFAGFCLATVLFTYAFVPETRGKNFSEIQEILNS